MAPARTRLTKRLLDSLTAGERDTFYWDSEVPGLGFKIAGRRSSPSAKIDKTAKTSATVGADDDNTRNKGHRSFVLQYRMPGRQRTRRIGLGEYGKLTLDQARAEANALWGKIRAGKDPMGERQATRAAERAGTSRPVTVGDLIDEYLKREGGAKRSAGEIRRSLEKEVRPAWGARRIEDVGRRDVVELLDGVVDRGAPVAANRLKARISRLFNFGIERGLIDANPCGRMKPPGGKETARARELSGDEIGVFWRALDSAAMEPGIKQALRFMLATGQRRGEVIGLHKGEIVAADRAWLLPGERTKNGREHWVPLSATAWAILEEITPDPLAGLYFASPRTGRAYNGRSIDHAVRARFKSRQRRKSKDAPVPPLAGKMAPFTPHDLRRTMATKLRELGVSRDDLKLILNHADASVTGIYDRYTGRFEKTRAMGLWSNYLKSLIDPAPDNVLPIRSAPTAS